MAFVTLNDSGDVVSVHKSPTRETVEIADTSPKLTAYTNAAGLVSLRAERDARLSACDWTQVNDAPVNQALWGAYRQELRDMPANTDDPLNPVWPVEPAV